MNKQDQNKELPQEILKENLKKVSLANECSVLMTLLCEKMGLNPQETTHQEFINKFAGIQTDSLEAEKQLNELYLLGREVMKPKKKRLKRDTVQEKEKIVEKLDSYIDNVYEDMTK